MELKDMLEWAAERGFRTGWKEGEVAGRRAAVTEIEISRAREAGARAIREEAHQILPKEPAA